MAAVEGTTLPSAHNQVDSRLCAFHMCKRICAFFYVLLDMCEAYVRLICAQLIHDVLPTSSTVSPPLPVSTPAGPPGSQQEAPREPPRAPGESTYQTFSFLTLPPRGGPEDAPEAPGNQPHTTPHIYCTLENRGQEPGARNQPHIKSKQTVNSVKTTTYITKKT